MNCKKSFELFKSGMFILCLSIMLFGILGNQGVQAATKDKGENVNFNKYNFLEFTVEDPEKGTAIGHLYTVSNSVGIQNLSESKTVKNISFKYKVVDNNGKVVWDKSKTNKLHVTLEPRKKAKTSMDMFLGEEYDGTFDVTNELQQYSYVLNGKKYIIDLKSNTAKAVNVKSKSNVNYDEKNILAIDDVIDEYIEFKNTSDIELKTLELSVVVYDCDIRNNPQNVTDRELTLYGNDGNYIISSPTECRLGGTPILGGETGFVGNEDPDEKIRVVGYEYTTNDLDDDGYNRYKIDLISNDAIGKKDESVMKVDVDVDAKTEFQPYAEAFGREIADTQFQVKKVTKTKPTKKEAFLDSYVPKEKLYLKNPPKFLNLKGTFHFVRDYDSLTVESFEYKFEKGGAKSQGYILSALEEAFGSKYESYDNWYEWKNVDGLNVVYKPKSKKIIVSSY